MEAGVQSSKSGHVAAKVLTGVEVSWHPRWACARVLSFQEPGCSPGVTRCNLLLQHPRCAADISVNARSLRIRARAPLWGERDDTREGRPLGSLGRGFLDPPEDCDDEWCAPVGSHGLAVLVVAWHSAGRPKRGQAMLLAQSIGVIPIEGQIECRRVRHRHLGYDARMASF